MSEKFDREYEAVHGEKPARHSPAPAETPVAENGTYLRSLGAALNRQGDHNVANALYAIADDFDELSRQLAEKQAQEDKDAAEIRGLKLNLTAERERAEGLQAKIDALMLEYCPKEMTEEQQLRWLPSQDAALAARPEEGKP